MKIYLKSSESSEFYSQNEIVYQKLIKKKVFFKEKYYMHIELAESVPLFGLEKYCINQKFGANFFIAARYRNESVKNINTRPITVNIFISKRNNYTIINEKELIHYGIGEVFLI
jgi:hypothetical protein